MDNLTDEIRFDMVIRLPREVEVVLEERLLTQAGLTRPAMGYHVSVLGPFALRAGFSAEALSVAAKVCAARRPLAVRLRGLAVYSGPQVHVLVIPVLPGERLRRLHGALRIALDAAIVLQREGPPEAYRPHVTLALGLSGADLANILRPDRQLAPDAGFTADALWLAEQRPWGPWLLLDRFPFAAPER